MRALTAAAVARDDSDRNGVTPSLSAAWPGTAVPHGGCRGGRAGSEHHLQHGGPEY